MIGMKTEIMSYYSYYTCFLSILLMQRFSKVSAVEATTVQPSLTTTTEASTTNTTSTTPTEATKFIGSHDFNYSATALKEIDATIPTTTVQEMDTTIPTTSVPYTTKFSTVKPMKNLKVTSSVCCGTSNVTKSPVKQRTICYPAGKLSTVTSKTTQNDTASTYAARTLEDTPETSFVDLTLRKKGLEEAGILLSGQANGIRATDPNPSAEDFWVAMASPKVDNNSTLVTKVTTHTTIPLTNGSVPSNTAKNFQSSSTTTSAKYGDFLAEGRKRKPFTKSFQRFLLRMTQLNEDTCTEFASSIAKRLIHLAEHDNLQHFGSTIASFLYNCSKEVLNRPQLSIKWLVRRGHSQMLHRRDVLSTDINNLLDLMNKVFIPEEEEAIEGIVNDTLAFPNTKKTIYDFVEDIVRKVILIPSWRLTLSKDSNGEILIQSLNKIIKDYNGQIPFRRSGNLSLEKNITRFKDINSKLVRKYSKERPKNARPKSTANEIKNKEVTKKKKNIDLEAEQRKGQTKSKYSGKILTDSVLKYYNDVPTEAYWNADRSRKIIRDNESSSMRNQNKYPKSKLNKLYKKYKHNKKRNKAPNMRQKLTFMGNIGEFSPFGLKPAPKNNAATISAFNNGSMSVLNRQRNLEKYFDSQMTMVLPLKSVTKIPQLYLTPIDSINHQGNIEEDFNIQMITVLPVTSTTETPQLYLTHTVFTKTLQNSKTIQRFGDNIEVHKYIATKKPNYLRMQPTANSNTPDYTEFISFEINNMSNIVNIGMRLQLKKTARPQAHSETSAKQSVNFLTNKAVTISSGKLLANSQPTVSVLSSKNEVSIWNPYKMDKFFEKSKAAANDAKQNVILRMMPTVEDSKDMSIFDSHAAFTLAKGLEIPVLGDVKYVTEITRKYDENYEHVYRKKKHHAKRKRNKHKHKMHKLGRRESFQKKKDVKIRLKRKLRNYKRQRYHIKRYHNIDKYGWKNDKHIWDYYWKRAKVKNQSDTESSVYSSLDSVQDSLPNEYDKNEITSNGYHHFSRKTSTAGRKPPHNNGNNIKKDLEINRYEKDKSIVGQSTRLQYFEPSKGNKSYKKMNNHYIIKEYEDEIKTFSERIKKVKLSTRKQLNEHKLTYYVIKPQKKKPKYAYHTTKSLQKVKPQRLLGVNDIFRHTLLTDIDRIKQQVGKDIKYNEDKYYKRKKLLEKLPHIAKTSPKNSSIKPSKHATNLYIKDLKVPKIIIDVRRYVLEDLRRNPQDAKRALKFSTVNTLVDSAYSDEEKELKNNLYDAFRHGDRTYFRRNLNHDSTAERALRGDSEYTDTEVVLKQKIYKSIKKHDV